ncbi:MAG: hypothetical protein J5I93_19050 [Pirellulaceae bacterium]|nr:hypothetical protein [Pirellulaceae bacterium]
MPKRKKSHQKNPFSQQPADDGSTPPQGSLPDRRALEGVLRQFASGLGDGEAPVDRAQQIMYQAFDAPSARQRIALAQRALQVSPDCTDAYVLLAEYAETLPEAQRLYQQGIDAAHRVLGERAFREWAGDFWGVLETRPYMRAREGLANCLWAAGEHDLAIGHFQDMLRLNPGDNQGIRYRLAASLLALERHDELARLLADYSDDAMAEWSYTRALLAFRVAGDSPQARELLRQAQAVNAHVPDYLTGSLPMPDEAPEMFGLGSREEAICYAATYLPAWRDTNGATSWLRKTLQIRTLSRAEEPRPDWNQMKHGLRQARQDENDVWELDLRIIPLPPEALGAGQKVWGLILASATSGDPLVMDLLEDRPADSEIWGRLLTAMLNSNQGQPQRPAEVRVTRKTWYNAWKSKLQQVGIRCRLSRELKHVDGIYREARLPPDLSIRLGLERQAGGEPIDAATLPQEAGEVWQMELRRFPGWVEHDGQPARPWVLMVVDAESELILATNIDHQRPATETAWEGLLQAMGRPETGKPHRPGIVQVASAELHELLAPRLEPLDVRCVLADSLEPLNRLIDDLVDHLLGPQRLGALIQAPGVTHDDVRRFFAAAAEFYRRRPWRHVSSESVIRVDCENVQSGPWYLVVMGQSGIELGLALYESASVLRDILIGGLSAEETTRRSMGLSVIFVEEFMISAQDLDTAQAEGWPVAGPEAYPSAMRLNPGGSIRAPLCWELRLLTGCLSAVPEFIENQRDDHRYTFSLGEQSVTLRLAWHEME